MWLGLLLGIVFGVGAMWVIRKGIIVKWFEWVLAALAFLSLYGGITHYVGSLHEFEPTAGLYGLYIFGGIALLLFGFTAQLVWRRNRKVSSAS
ncbi:dehalogenase [Dehalogenimonas alkenigignens]|uniref:Reductive dehalogenase anchoring protein n=1 Tax=Dehalogenimonas alkenigignens TaxID=1217799 RepID=A0A0W0GKG8_9CHLR|nr:reductive dehalogenase anchoring protein [Dehalogenimonas alkenigignens]PVV83164.1 dehalogenase [Dehalogenimonas alkenigignens]